MILSAQSIRARGIISPFCERTKFAGVSYGLSAAGYDVRVAQDIRIERGQFVLASTLESFDMPGDVMAFPVDKSTWARCGLSCFNTCIEPGWKAQSLTLELTMHGAEPLKIPAGAGIVQIIFFQLDQATVQPYDGKYQHAPAGPQPAIYDHAA